MKKINKIIFLMLLAFMLKGCENTLSEVVDEESNNQVYKDEVLVAINTFRESLYELGASNNKASKKVSLPAKVNSGIIHTKDELVASNIKEGVDLEWLDMAVHILNFAEVITNATGTLGEETFFYDVLDDPSVWVWPIYDNTKVILSYTDDVLYLRVIDDSLIQTFFFEYVEEDKVRIFRLYESASSEGNTLTIEDFIEKTGLSIWSSNGYYDMSSRVTSEDGGLYTLWTTNSGEITFGNANYVINGVPIHIHESSNGGLNITYDFKYVDVFDSFDEEGVLFLNEEIVQLPLTMNVRTAYHGSDMYVLTGAKILNEPANSLEVEEVNIQTDITYEDIKSNIDSLLQSTEINGVSYDYSLGVDVILSDLSDLLYLDYD